MKKTAFALFSVCITMVCHAQLPDTSLYDSWAKQENQRLSMVLQPKRDPELDKWLTDVNKADEAARAGDHQAACEALLRLLNSSQSADVNKACDRIALGLHYWCLHKDSQAKYAISKAIRHMKNGDFLGGGCENRAETLLNKIYRLPRSMSYDEIQALIDYTMQPVYDQFRKTCARRNARLDAMIGKFESEINSLRREGNFQASMAKFQAELDYVKSTGRSFNPNIRPTNPYVIKKWEACKRVYDIFER